MIPEWGKPGWIPGSAGLDTGRWVGWTPGVAGLDAKGKPGWIPEWGKPG